MIKRETKTVTEIVEKVIKERYFCDRCGTEMMREYYSRDRNLVEFREGDSYPEGGYERSNHAYLCDDCAKAILNLLEANGVHFETAEIHF